MLLTNRARLASTVSRDPPVGQYRTGRDGEPKPSRTQSTIGAQVLRRRRQLAVIVGKS